MERKRTRVEVIPCLNCPECGRPAISAHGRGRYDKDGNDIPHKDECRCRWCNWWWYSDMDPVVCVCGARIKVMADDDENAYVECVP